ncbi:HEAT repeat domain-containing protein [Polyangium sp. 15x6]|nr:HEAT repeat domain-containing protein [Polyangium sp. 15x6]MDI3291467.1 HEAT repeat domain-containing protein [Polyangium sp. 15x6]
MTHLRLCLLLGPVLFTACARPPAGTDRPTTPVAPTEGAERAVHAASPAQPDPPEEEHLDASRLERLLVQLDSPEPEQAIEAADTLARIRSAEAATVDHLSRKLASPEGEVRERAVSLLGRTGFPSAIPVLIRALADPEHNVNTQASSNLIADFGTSALGPLMAALEDQDARRRAMAALTLRHLGPGARAALPRLRVLAEDADVEVHVNALLALGGVSSRDEDQAALLPLLLERLEHKNPRIRETAAFVLRDSLGNRFPEAIPHLIRALSDTNPSVQIDAAFALGAFGPAARTAVPRLRKLAAKPACFPPDGCVDAAAREALRFIGVP